jgi:hypothetical protein
LPRDEAVAALRNRARILRASAEMQRFALASQFTRQAKPVHVGWMFERMIAQMETEIAWCERIAARLEGGAALFPEGFVSYQDERAERPVTTPGPGDDEK